RDRETALFMALLLLAGARPGPAPACFRGPRPARRPRQARPIGLRARTGPGTAPGPRAIIGAQDEGGGRHRGRPRAVLRGLGDGGGRGLPAHEPGDGLVRLLGLLRSPYLRPHAAAARARDRTALLRR